MSEQSSLLQPTPRRQFEFTPSSTEPSTPRTPSQESRGPANADLDPNGLTISDRTRSIINLTSSTLFGIYAPSDSSKDGASTPWGTGAETPALRASVDDKKPPVIGPYEGPHSQRSHSHPPLKHGFQNYYLPLIMRSMLLFLFGVAYGSIVTHLHDNQHITPIKVEGIERYTWHYLAFWGVAGVVLGRLLPWVDIFWEETMGNNQSTVSSVPPTEGSEPTSNSADEDRKLEPRTDNELGADWNPAVRSIGAFVGIAFAIRRLPWQSTLQVSFTLALVNPALWYLVDRSKPGFVLSTIVGIAGTAILLGVSPSIVPAPPAPSPLAGTTTGFPDELPTGVGIVSNESIAVSIWIASVLFCSSVCFGNIGRKLALEGPVRRQDGS